MSGIVVAILVVALVVILLTVDGDHGPGRHGGHAARSLEARSAVPGDGGDVVAARPMR